MATCTKGIQLNEHQKFTKMFNASIARANGKHPSNLSDFN